MTIQNRVGSVDAERIKAIGGIPWSDGGVEAAGPARCLGDGGTETPSSDPYLAGLCMVMAAVLQERIGGGIVGIFDDVWDTRPRHLGVATDDGYCDARGTGMSGRDFLQGFETPSSWIEPVDRADLERFYEHRITDWTIPEERLQAVLG
jgi:hypothetical protein